MSADDPRVDILAEATVARWGMLSEKTRAELRPGYVDLLARLDAAVDVPIARVAVPEFPFDPPLSPPSHTGCRHCSRKLVIVGREPADGGLEVVGMPRFRWAHADDLTVDCIRTYNDPVKPYSGWMSKLDEQLIHAEENRRYDEREDALDAAQGGAS